MCYGTEMIQKCMKGLVFMLLFKKEISLRVLGDEDQ